MRVSPDLYAAGRAQLIEVRALLQWLVGVVLAVVENGQRRLLGSRCRSTPPCAPDLNGFPSDVDLQQVVVA